MVVGEIAEDKDIVVIGGGPGGYHAAIRAANLGRQVTLIEREDLGGTCLHKGCIPSKVFTHFAQEFKKTKHLKEMGMEFGEVKANLATLQQYKNKKITQLRTGIESLCKSNQVEIVKGSAYFLSESRVGVEHGHEFSLFNFKEAIVATGGDFHYPEGVKFDADRILKEREIFQLGEIPGELIVYGADYISLEIASVFSILGSNVTLIFHEESAFDSSIKKELYRQFKKQKINVIRTAILQTASETDGLVRVKVKKDNGEIVSIEGTHFVTSGQVKPNLPELGLDRLPLNITERGYIETDPGGTDLDPPYMGDRRCHGRSVPRSQGDQAGEGSCGSDCRGTGGSRFAVCSHGRTDESSHCVCGTYGRGSPWGRVFSHRE
ncbi:FAD-dependent oxidoreductase [Rossellomorea sp. AcN35-11]|nr:FAD-dependent oxidoreductase [Rossellomorea sp. AcN35-11]